MKAMLLMKYLPAFVFLLNTASVQCSVSKQVTCSEPRFYGDLCECFENQPYFKQLVCKKIKCTKEFTNYIEEVKGYNVRRLILENVEIRHLPKVLFERNITWIEATNTTFRQQLFEYVPENNKIDHLLLNEVKIGNVTWNWQVITPLQKLATLRMRKMPLGGLQNFTYFKKSLRHIIFYGCDLKKLRDDQFREYRELEMIDIRHDRLTELKRSMFPTPSKLRIMIFRNHHLTSLPENLFEGMRDLTVIDFQQNQLTVLSENTLKPVLSPAIFLQGNPLICDCDLKWILKIKLAIGTCDFPKFMNGKDLKYIAVYFEYCSFY